MNSRQIRQEFLDFFRSKGHQIVPSAPMVAKDDPTLMFINAGMNPFKDFFLGNRTPDHARIANTQRCLRVSGKHNDLEEVGRDSYHHTMFEMLGNWSFGDYFKQEAIAWAWELLTDIYKLPSHRLYVTYFGGDPEENLEPDTEAYGLWKALIEESHILPGSKKDNFWEMGDTGPCGPCSEIHIDLRSDEDRQQTDGAELVNRDHPLVVEIWNLVFMQFNRRADGSLHALPSRHVDTGMGLERLCMALQAKQSNYETDLFSILIDQIEGYTGLKYTNSYASDAHTDIAMRVIADHLRAVSFAIADGQLPSNTGAGYVIRRILRRAVRYYFSFLNQSEPLLYKLVPVLAGQFEHIFHGLKAQQSFVVKVITEEEKTFLRTLEAGLRRIEQTKPEAGMVLSGLAAFELYDTYGFPVDLTRLIAGEKGWTVDEEGFSRALDEQRNRSRRDAEKETGDWVDVHGGRTTDFVGYEQLEVSQVRILAYRMVQQKKSRKYQLLLDTSPFYPEGGGQVGDTGSLTGDNAQQTVITNTYRENDLIIHECEQLPQDPAGLFTAKVDGDRRTRIVANHSATHLLHAALRKVLGEHVEQRGSLVHPDYLRFDFSHFARLTEEEIRTIEDMVNRRIRDNISRKEARNLPIEEAQQAGARMLFGEKYGSHVRMITFDETFSIELCGGCHVASTGEIGQFRIRSEGAIAAGIRRIEAITGEEAERYVATRFAELNAIRHSLKNPADTLAAIEQLQEENKLLRKQIDTIKQQEAVALAQNLESKISALGEWQVLITAVNLTDAGAIKDVAFSLKGKHPDLAGVFTATVNGKPNITVFAGDKVVAGTGFNAGQIVRDLAAMIRGGGGGQAFFATAGGKVSDALPDVLVKATEILTGHLG